MLQGAEVYCSRGIDFLKCCYEALHFFTGLPSH